MSRQGRRPIRTWRRQWQKGWIHEMQTARAQRNARIDMMLFDQGLVRRLWPNLQEIDDGVWRSSQPDPKMLRRLAERGFRAVLNPRGATSFGSYVLERDACAALGLALVDFEMHSRRLPPVETILALDEVFAAIPRPFAMHCKSGADRTGFAAGLYLMLRTDAPVERALGQLSWRYFHLSRSAAGVLRLPFEAYAAARAEREVSFRDWLRTGYDPEALMAGFRAGPAAELVATGVLGRE